MLVCARRAFPGMVFSLLLVAPGYALAADGPQIGGGAGNSAVAIRKPPHIVRKPIAKPATRASGAMMHRFGWEQSGMASWYGGERWQGKLTASGARYDQNALTAAHATLPIGSRVKVTIVGTNQAVVVTINDRPGTKTRIIDLSRAAAKELGILSRGVARVNLFRLDS